MTQPDFMEGSIPVRPAVDESDGPLSFLRQLAAQRTDVFVLQCGANDGIAKDPVNVFFRDYGWHGLLLEPVQHIFRKLQQTYDGLPRLRLVNAALASNNGDVPFYRVLPGPLVPDWCDHLGSFSRDVILSHRYKFEQIEDHLVLEHVAGITFQRLVERYGIERIDVLMIDTEGFDAQILNQVDFQRFRPSVIVYERIHLDPQSERDSIQLLEDAHYTMHRTRHDYVGVLQIR
jgi:FkbM family methyltransferase